MNEPANSLPSTRVLEKPAGQIANKFIAI